MSLLDHAIWWHVYPLGAVGAPIRPAGQTADAPVVHRLPRLEAWLDHVVELGCSGLLLGPVFASRSHGYDTLDHLRVDPRLGDEADLQHLVDAARARGISVMLDGVFNHVSVDHPLVRRAVADGLDVRGPVRIEVVDGVARPRAWEGHDDLIELNHENQQVKDLVTDVMRYWLRRGIAGWRLDVAYAVAPAFWREVLGRVREEFPATVFLGEVIHGDYAEIAAAGTLDTVTQYELWKAIWSSLADHNAWELAWTLERHDGFAQRFVPQTFVGNHDVDRIADVVGDAGAAIALVVLVTVPGSPSVYYGDEHAFRGRKGTGLTSDDALRPTLPARPEDLAPDGLWMFRLHQQLIGLRRRHAWLVRARLRVVEKTNTTLAYECTDGERTLHVDLDLSAEPRARVTAGGEELFAWPV